MSRQLLRWSIPERGSPIGGREPGRALLTQVLGVLRETEADTTLDIDFRAVRIMDFSAVDEFLVNLLRRVSSGELGNKRVVLSGLSPEVKESVNAVLQMRKLRCLEWEGEHQLNLLGDLSPPLRATLDYVIEHGTTTVGEIVRFFKIKPTAAANRLSTLAQSGLLVREPDHSGRKGRQYIYRSATHEATRPTAKRDNDR